MAWNSKYWYSLGRSPPSVCASPFLDRHHGLRLLSAEPLVVEVLEELWQRRLPGLLSVVVELTQFLPVQPDFACHLYVRVRQAVALPRRDPVLDLQKCLLAHAHGPP
jgi:hypothetical protein